MSVSYRLIYFMAILSLTAVSCGSSRHHLKPDAEGYRLVFDGKSLDGWVYDPVYWRVENGTLIGEVTPSTLLKRNTFIIKKGLETKDFDLKVLFRISALGNSGINYRSELIDSLPFAMRGYQADIDGPNRYTGQNYEERGRTTLAYRGQKTMIANLNDALPFKDHIRANAWVPVQVLDSSLHKDSLKSVIKNGDWNECHIVAKGNRLQHYINDVLMSDVTDNDNVNRKFSGGLGVQVHVGPPMKIEFKNFRIKKL